MSTTTAPTQKPKIEKPATIEEWESALERMPEKIQKKLKKKITKGTTNQEVLDTHQKWAHKNQSVSH